MADIFGNILPWFGSKTEKKESTTAETTSGSDKQPIHLVPVAANLNPGEAAVIRSRLESEGIPAFVQQEAFGSFIGLTVGKLGSAKVVVPEPLAERALSILAETYEVLEENDEYGDDLSEDDPEI
jgi:hypothetical protein